MGSGHNTGYGIATKNLILSLEQLGHSVAFFSKSSLQTESEQELEILSNCAGKSKLFDIDAPTVNMWHQNDLAMHVGRGLYVGFPFFELDKFTIEEKHSLICPDALFSCSKWASDIIKDNIGKETQIVPLGVNREIFNENIENSRWDDILKPNNEYVFLNIGKWEKRKGHDILGKCFSRAFDKKDNVKLVMMPHNPFLKEHQLKSWYDQYRGLSLASKIQILPQVLTHTEVAGIMSSADCGVFPARAEGWNLELLEVMSCGKPVITTDYSAHTEYCDRSNAFLIDFIDLEDAYDGIWFYGQGRWMDFDYEQEEQLIEHMRFCYKNRPTNHAGIETANRFSWQNSAAKLLTALENLLQ